MYALQPLNMRWIKLWDIGYGHSLFTSRSFERTCRRTQRLSMWCWRMAMSANANNTPRPFTGKPLLLNLSYPVLILFYSVDRAVNRMVTIHPVHS